jgi:hypothetical protein
VQYHGFSTDLLQKLASGMLDSMSMMSERAHRIFFAWRVCAEMVFKRFGGNGAIHALAVDERREREQQIGTAAVLRRVGGKADLHGLHLLRVGAAHDVVRLEQMSAPMRARLHALHVARRLTVCSHVLQNSRACRRGKPSLRLPLMQVKLASFPMNGGGNPRSRSSIRRCVLDVRQSGASPLPYTEWEGIPFGVRQ